MRFLFIGALILVGLYFVRRLQGVNKMPSSLVKQKIDAGATIIDVRTPEEFRDGAYPGAINIPVSNLGARLADLSKSKPVVLYCASGARSASAARALKQAGFSDVVNAGGLGDMP
jgi:phage shock protein E